MLPCYSTVFCPLLDTVWIGHSSRSTRTPHRFIQPLHPVDLGSFNWIWLLLEQLIWEIFSIFFTNHPSTKTYKKTRFPFLAKIAIHPELMIIHHHSQQKKLPQKKPSETRTVGWVLPQQPATSPTSDNWKRCSSRALASQRDANGDIIPTPEGLFRKKHLPSLKLTASLPLKMDWLEDEFPFGKFYFQGLC